jgi:hypothetical protein
VRVAEQVSQLRGAVLGAVVAHAERRVEEALRLEQLGGRDPRTEGLDANRVVFRERLLDGVLERDRFLRGRGDRGKAGGGEQESVKGAKGHEIDQSTIQPSARRMTRLPKEALSLEWVTCTIVTPFSWLSFLKSSMISRAWSE